MNKKIETYHVKNSSLIVRVDYDHLMENLKVYFRTSGDVYDYTGVPYKLFEELKEAKSAGKFFHSQIKPKYEYLKLTKKTKESLNKSKKAKKIIMSNFGSKSWFKGVTARNKDNKIIVYITDSNQIETIKNIIPSEMNIDFDFKIIDK